MTSFSAPVQFEESRALLVEKLVAIANECVNTGEDKIAYNILCVVKDLENLKYSSDNKINGPNKHQLAVWALFRFKESDVKMANDETS